MKTQAFAVSLEIFVSQAQERLHDPAFLRGLGHSKDVLLSIVGDFEMQREAVESDTDLVLSAKSRLTEEAREDALRRVEKVKDLSEQETRLHQKAFSDGPEKSDGQQILEYLKLQEVRQTLVGLDELQLQALLQKALAEGQDDLICAVLQSPVPMLSPEKSEELAERRAFIRLEKENPALLNEFKDLQLINGLVKGMKNTTRSHLRA